MEDLRLTPEDFSKKILDVGAGSAQFAKWAKEHDVSQEIYSLEPKEDYPEEKNNTILAKAESIPFKDESFDLIVSNAAIPNIYIGDKYAEKEVEDSFNEMIRVLKSGGEIRLAHVLFGKEYRSQIILKQSIERALKDIESKEGFEVERIRTPIGDTYEYVNHEPTELLAEAYLIIIRKK